MCMQQRMQQRMQPRIQLCFYNKLKDVAASDWTGTGIAAKDNGKAQVKLAPKPITP